MGASRRRCRGRHLQQPLPHLADGDNPHGRVLDGLGDATTRTVKGNVLVQTVALDGLEAVTAMVEADRHALLVQLRVISTPVT